MSEQSTTLYFREGSSDKVYQLDLREKAPGWVVDFAFGPRGKAMKPGTKTQTPVPLAKAQQIYAQLLKEKTGKGYSPGEDGVRYAGTENAGRASGHAQQLPSAITLERARDLLRDPEWGMQEKANGERRTLLIEDGRVQGVNKLGLLVPVPGHWAQEFSSIQFGKANIEIDGEQVGDKFKAFDLLAIGSRDLRALSFSQRYSELQIFLEASGSRLPSFELLTAAFSQESKAARFDAIEKENLEGVVFKRRDAPYESGRSEDALKYKFLESCSCIVLERNAQRSVRIGLLDKNGAMVPVGNVTIPANHNIPPVGSVVEVQYLYFNPGGAFEQPVYQGERTDILREEALRSQVKRLKPGVIHPDAIENDSTTAPVRERMRA